MIAVISAALQLLIMLLGEWFKFSNEKKAKAKEILKEVPNAKTASDITRIFDAVNRL